MIDFDLKSLVPYLEQKGWQTDDILMEQYRSRLPPSGDQLDNPDIP